MTGNGIAPRRLRRGPVGAAWILLLPLAPAGALELRSETLLRLRGAAGAAPAAVGEASPEAASERSKTGFEEPIDDSVFAPPKEEPGRAVPALAPSSRDYVVGRPQRLREPRNPLKPDGKLAKKDKTWLIRAIGAGLLGAVGALVGFLLAGPLGAGIGAAVGAAGGWMLVP